MRNEAEWARHKDSPKPSPIRTRREIVPGIYGHVEVSNNPDAGLMFFLPLNNYNAEELREAAHIFNQLAEVLEENK